MTNEITYINIFIRYENNNDFNGKRKIKLCCI